MEKCDIGSTEDNTTPRFCGPLTKEETEQLQREANEDTSESEELRLFLKELREKVKEDNEQQQQQIQLPITTLPIVGLTKDCAQPQQYNNLRDSDTIGSVRPMRSSVSSQPAYQQHVTNMTGDYQTGYCTSLTDLNPTDTTSPDGGWGWIVVFGSFCCMILVDGVCFSYGLLINPICPYKSLRVLRHGNNLTSSSSMHDYTQLFSVSQPTVGSCIPISEMGEEFGVQKRSLLLTPGALLIGLYLFLGPLVSALSNQFDFRPVAMVGALISTVAFLVSSFANTIEEMTLSFGLGGGIGFALIYLPAIATVGHWFQHQRPLAVGIALCGSGMGCLLAGQIIPSLVEWVTWRGAVLILAATSFQCLTLIALFRSWDVHFQIIQNQRFKRELRNAARRAAAIRKAEAERVLLEARRRKLQINQGKAVLSAAAAAAHAHDATGLKKHVRSCGMPKQNNRSDVYKFSNDIKQTRSNHTGQKKVLHISGKAGAVGGYGRGRLSIPTTGRATSQPHRNGRNNNNRGGHVTVQRSSHNQVPGRVRLSGGPKRVPSHRMMSYRGSIMQRIIEEKHRQRTISVGSLDGMVITRDNELISASNVINTDKPLLSASTVQRISDSVVRKIENKLSNATAITAVSTTSSSNVIASSPASVISSRAALRACLPQLVEDYIQSQLSVTLQQQQAKLSPVPSCLPINQGVNSVRLSGVINCGDIVASPTQSFRTVTKLNDIPENNRISHLTDDIQSMNLPAAISGQCSPPLTYNSTIQQQSVVKHTDLVQLTEMNGNANQFMECASNLPSSTILSNATNCATETSSQSNVSLNRQSLSNHLNGVQEKLDLGVHILDDEIRADINRLIQKEITRPQYKKDFFYTGSFRQLDSRSHQIQQPHQFYHLLLQQHQQQQQQQQQQQYMAAQPTQQQIPDKWNIGRKFSSTIPVNEHQLSYLMPFAPLPIIPAPPTSVDFRQQQLQQQSRDNASLQNLPSAFVSNLLQSLRGTKARNSTTTTTLSDDVKHPDSDHYEEEDADGDDEDEEEDVNADDGDVVVEDENGVQYLCKNMDRDIDDEDGDEDDDDNDVDVDDDRGDEGDDEDDELVAESENDTEKLNNDAVQDNSVAGEDNTVTDGIDDEEMETNIADGLQTDGANQKSQSKQAKYHKYTKLCHIICKDLKHVLCPTACDPLRTFIIDLLSPKLLLNSTFIFLLLSSVFAMLGIIVPFLMLPDLLAELNLDIERSGYIISAIGGGNIIGRLVVTAYIKKAWSSTCKWANSMWINNASLFVTGVIVLLMPLTRTQHTLLLFVSTTFGFSSAVFVSLKSILVVELLGLDHLTNAFGYLLLFQGVAVALGPPVAGHLRDICIDKLPPLNIFTAHNAQVHHASSFSFYFAGSSVLLAFVLACPLRYLSTRRKQQYDLVDLDNRDHMAYTIENGQENYQVYHHNYDQTVPPPYMMHDMDLAYVNPNEFEIVQQGTNADNTAVVDTIKSPASIVLTTSANRVLNDVPPTVIVNNTNSVVQANGETVSTVVATSCMNTGVVVAPLLNSGEEPMVYENVAVLPVITPSPVTSSTLPVEAVEIIELKEEPGLEPVVEEEEEYEVEEEPTIHAVHQLPTDGDKFKDPPQTELPQLMVPVKQADIIEAKELTHNNNNNSSDVINTSAPTTTNVVQSPA